MTYLLGLDIGTTGAKAILIDEDGNVIAAATNEYPLSTPRPHWSEQNPEDWWQASVASVRQVLSKSWIPAQDLAGLGLTGQMHGLVLLDDRNQVLRPAILWNDQRTGEQCRTITDRIGFARLLELTGNPALTGFTAPKLLWVREQEPDIYAHIAHFLLPKDYIRYRLTGELATEVSDASGTLLFDVTNRKWSEEMLAALEISRAWAPACTESPEISGRVSGEAAAATGLAAGTPVAGGGGDQAAQAVGTGLAEEGLVSATIGTSGVVFAPTRRPRIEPQGRLHAFCHAVPGQWHVMGVMLAAGGSLRWFRDTFCQGEKIQAEEQRVDPYEIMLADAAQAPAGCEGLIFLPYLSGERTPYPDPHARGVFCGLTLRHRKAHLVRAVLEGVGFGLCDSLELIRQQGIAATQIRVSGGGARSALWRQILADIFRTEVVTVTAAEGAAFGAALLAGVGTGVYPNVSEAGARTIRIVESARPDAQRAERYEKQYRLYRELYPSLQSLFPRLE